MINMFKKKFRTKKSVINLNGLYDIFKNNYFDGINNPNDYDSIKSDWSIVGSDLTWAMETEQKRITKQKI